MLEMFHLQNISRLNIHNRPVFHRTLWTLLHIYVIYIIYTIYIYIYCIHARIHPKLLCWGEKLDRSYLRPPVCEYAMAFCLEPVLVRSFTFLEDANFSFCFIDCCSIWSCAIWQQRTVMFQVLIRECDLDSKD